MFKHRPKNQKFVVACEILGVIVCFVVGMLIIQPANSQKPADMSFASDYEFLEL